MTQPPILFLFREDLRLSDNPGLYQAALQGPVLPVYIWDEHSFGLKLGSCSRWWLEHSLTSLNRALKGKLNFYHGNTQEILKEILNRIPVRAVYWNRLYDTVRFEADRQREAWLQSKQIPTQNFKANVLWDPWDLLKDDGSFYKVFTPFYKKMCSLGAPRKPLPMPPHLACIKDPEALSKEALNLSPQGKWVHQLAPFWTIGEEGAKTSLEDFCAKGLASYAKGRDLPAETSTSLLSPHLHFGEISPFVVWHRVQAEAVYGGVETGAEAFLRELGWREFAYYTLYHCPKLPFENIDPRFNSFAWTKESPLLETWQRGRTGHPFVDAGMRQLWETGIMHNRVRMIVGSFLVKNLLIDWRQGAAWFWDCLVDADLANNSLNWQWVAGCGIDATPYFRIFNPVTQGERFDPQGVYTKRFVPELRNLPAAYLFKPWEVPAAVLREAGIEPGTTYSFPVVDLTASRKRALKAFEAL